MSMTKRHQNWCVQETKIVFEDNQEITDTMLFLLRKNYPKNTYKLISKNMNINFFKVRNWFQKGNGLNAYELWLMIKRFDFVRIYLGLKLSLSKANFHSREENRKEIIKNVVLLLKKNPEATIKYISDKLFISKKSVEYILNRLKMSAKIERLGATKKGRWIVK